MRRWPACVPLWPGFAECDQARQDRNRILPDICRGTGTPSDERARSYFTGLPTPRRPRFANYARRKPLHDLHRIRSSTRSAAIAAISKPIRSKKCQHSAAVRVYTAWSGASLPIGGRGKSPVTTVNSPHVIVERERPRPDASSRLCVLCRSREKICETSPVYPRPAFFLSPPPPSLSGNDVGR